MPVESSRQNTPKMNIAFVNQPYDRVVPPGQNSIGLIVYNTAVALAGAADVTLYANERPNGESIDGLPFRLKTTQVPVDDFLHRTAANYPRWVNRFGASGLADAHPQYARSVRASLDRSDAQIVHVMNYWNWSRTLRGRRKLVLEMQCEWLSQKDRKAVAAQLASVDAVVGVSDHISNLFRQSFPDYGGMVATVFNGADTEVFRPSANGKSAEEGDVQRLVFVGRTSPEKGIHTLLDAFSLVAESFPKARLDIVGPRTTLASEFIVDISADPLVRALKRFYDGSTTNEYQSYLDASLRRLGLEDRVIFHGPRPHADLIQTYQNADLVVNPSLSESFGIAMVEAMSCGTPVVGTKVGGMQETIVEGETGHLVEPEDPEALADAISKVLRSRERRIEMGRRGRERAVEHFSWRARGQRLLNLYNTLGVDGRG